MRRLFIPLGVALTLTLVLSACGGTEGFAVMASSPGSLEAGPPQRVMLALAGEEAELGGGPDLEVQAEFRREGESVVTVPTEWVWAIPEVRGFYVAHAEFDTPGIWEVVLHPEGSPPTEAAPFQVVEDASLPGIGEAAPASETRTHPPLPLEQLTTDPDPDPALYSMTVAEAVSNGTPAVIVFATPAFCQTATCGPTLDIVKAVASDYPEVDFVHVEVFENLDATSRGELREVPAVAEWGLRSEPWVFVVDSAGTITARFEGTVGASELERALADLG